MVHGCLHMPKSIRLYTLTTGRLLSVNYISIKLFKKAHWAPNMSLSSAWNSSFCFLSLSLTSSIRQAFGSIRFYEVNATRKVKVQPTDSHTLVSIKSIYWLFSNWGSELKRDRTGVQMRQRKREKWFWSLGNFRRWEDRVKWLGDQPVSREGSQEMKVLTSVNLRQGSTLLLIKTGPLSLFFRIKGGSAGGFEVRQTWIWPRFPHWWDRWPLASFSTDLKFIFLVCQRV